MIDFDKSICNPQFQSLFDSSSVEGIPLRELMIRCSLCRSIMEIAQKNINFGLMDKNERRTKRIVIRNNSEAVLEYSIRKSGSIASGDLSFTEGRLGVVRGYSKREVEFLFVPSLAGAFQEKLVIENIHDIENNQIVVVKANVKQPANFIINHQVLDFGPCLVDHASFNIHSLTLSNPSQKQLRYFEVCVDPDELQNVDLWLSLPDEADENYLFPKKPQRMMLTKEHEELIEQLKQKIKIANRKGRPDKAEKMTIQLAQLSAGQPLDKFNAENNSNIDTDEPASITSDEQLLSRGASGMKARKADNNIVFPIGPRCMRSVNVHLKVVSNPQKQASGTREPLYCNIKLKVHEHKNLDIIKHVTLKYCICWDERSYLQKLEESKNQKADIQDELSLAPFQSDALDRTRSLNILEAATPTGASTVEILSPLAYSELNVQVEIPIVDLGRLEIDEVKDCYFTLSNRSSTPRGFEIIPVTCNAGTFKILVSAAQSTFSGNETRRVDISLIPRLKGQHSCSCVIVDQLSMAETHVIFYFYGVSKTYLRFEKYQSDISDIQPCVELDMGHCYIDSGNRYAVVRPVTVYNSSLENVYLTAVSNLSQQCFLFSDLNLETSVTELYLPSSHRIVIYVALQPSTVPAHHRKSDVFGAENQVGIATKQQNDNFGLSNTPNQGDGRTLVGGIKFMVLIKDESIPVIAGITKVSCSSTGLVQVCTQMLKFIATIGQSVFSVSTTMIDLGKNADLGAVLVGGFWIYNSTPRMPLEFKVEVSSRETLVVGTASAGVFTDQIVPNTDESIGNRYWIPFSYKCIRMGLISEEIECTNINNASQRITVSIIGFIDPQSISVSLQPLSPGVSSFWNDIYVVPEHSASANLSFRQLSFLLQGKYPDGAFPACYTRTIELKNISQESAVILPLSNTCVGARWRSQNTPIIDVAQDLHGEIATHKTGFVRSMVHSGPSIAMESMTTAQLNATVSAPVAVTEDSAMQSILSGKSFVQQSHILLNNVLSNQIVNIMDLSASYCVSLANVEPKMFDLGKVGYVLQWADVKMSFRIENLADICLVHEIELPEYIDVKRSGSTAEAPSLKSKISAHAFQDFELSFKSRSAAVVGSGNQTFTIHIRNVYNPDNDMTILVKYFMTECELRFDRLNSGELNMPPLTHPAQLNSLPCDNWFTVTNVAEADIKLDILCTLSPDVASLVSVELLSRLNLPLTGSILLSPKCTTEIKVRAIALETSRLFSKDPRAAYLTNPDGITLGTLGLVARSVVGQDEQISVSRIVQNIPFRGTILEGRTLYVSQKHLEFHSIPPSEILVESNASRVICLEEQTIFIMNLSSHFPLEFKVFIEYPIEFALGGEKLFNISPLDDDMSGFVEPNGQISLHISLKSTNVGDTSENIKLHIFDKNSLNRQAHTISLNITEISHEESLISASPEASANNYSASLNAQELVPDIRRSIHIPSRIRTEESVLMSKELNSFDAVSTSASVGQDSVTALGLNNGKPIITIRGCKKIKDDTTNEFNGLYELDLGQQDLSSTPLMKRLLLESQSSSKLAYKIRNVIDSERNWILCSKMDGIIEGSSKAVIGAVSGNQINFTCMVSVRGSFTTYLVIQNLDNIGDTKVIRVMLEVVAKQNVKRSTIPIAPGSILSSEPVNNRVFDVYTHAVPWKENSIDLADVCFGSFYTCRSFIIYNRESVPLEFTVKSNLQLETDRELLFSLSRTSTRLFKSIKIAPESQSKVYVQFWPGLTTSITPNFTEQVNLEIHINCRLVKDYQMLIPFRALCHVPQIQLSNSEFFFKGTIMNRPLENSASDERSVQVTCAIDAVFTITNAFDSILDFEIYSDSVYFALGRVNKEMLSSKFTADQFIPLASNSYSIPPYKEMSFRVVPKLDLLNGAIEHLRKEKYFLKHIVVYNKRRPFESCNVNVKLSFGHADVFQFAYGTRASFFVLENYVIYLMRQIDSFRNTLFKDEDVLQTEIYSLYAIIINELIHYGTREEASESYIQLATLLFSVIFAHEPFADYLPASIENSNGDVKVWPPFLSLWVHSTNL